MVSYNRFINEIIDIRRWLYTTIYSYKASAQFLDKLMQNGTDVKDEVFNAFNESGCNVNSLVHRLSTNNIKTCKELALIRSISAFEVFTIDMIKEVFEDNKSPFFNNSEIQYHVNELLSCSDISELHTKYIERCCRDLHSRGFDDVTKFYKKTFQIDFQKFNTSVNSNCYGLPYIQQHHQMRHLIIHRLGKTDEQYRKKYNTSEETIKLNESELAEFFQVLLSFARYINDRMEAFITTNPPENKIAIKVELIDSAATALFEPTYALSVKKNLQLPLSVLLEGVEYETDSIFTVYLHGAFINLRKYYKQLLKHASSGELKVLSYDTISLSHKNRKIKQYEWADVQKVIELLPEQPWEKHIHKKIAHELGWSNNKVSGIIRNILMEHPSEISIKPRRITLPIGTTFALTLNIKGDLKNKVEWKSSNEEIASVDNGIITTISPGFVEVSAKVSNSTNYCTCTVIVAEKKQATPSD